jgi:hypothetical protein
MLKMEKTITTIFMVPTLKIGRIPIRENGFVNAFILDHVTGTHFDDSIYLLFRPEYPSRYRQFLNLEYQRTKAIVNDYDVSQGFSVCVYRLNPDFKQDFDLIRLSRYSKTSQAFQALFPKTVEIVKSNNRLNELSLQYRIFNKNSDLTNYWLMNNNSYKVGDEIWHKFEESRETLTKDVLSKELSKKSGTRDFQMVAKRRRALEPDSDNAAENPLD